MKRKIVVICVMTLLIGTVASQVSACTGFTYSDNENVFACHNEDWHSLFTLRFFPATDNRYGAMFIEVYDDTTGLITPFSGMNDQGLWYSTYLHPHLEQVNLTDLPDYYDTNSYYKFHSGEPCMFECATIEEALDFLDNYNHNTYADVQIFGADSTGNSVINEGDIRVYKQGNFQVVTNFLHSHPELGDLGINGFERYNTVVSMLENMMDPSVEYFRDILDAVHVEKTNSWTCHSMICDLSNQIIYLYYSGDYDKQVVIDLNEELKKGEHSILLRSLFEPEDNQSPDKPETPEGEIEGRKGREYTYSTSSADPEGDEVHYFWDWGDGNDSGWLGPYNSGETCNASHTWEDRGDYSIKVKAKDTSDAESDWSDPLLISMPKNKSTNPFLLRFLENHLHMFPLLRQLLDL